MIKSLVVGGMYNIGVDSSNKVRIGEDKISIKDIPYIRYKILGNKSSKGGNNIISISGLGNSIDDDSKGNIIDTDGTDKNELYINDEMIDYIKKSMSKFYYSVHIIDMPLNIASAENIKLIKDTFNSDGDINLAVMLKINISNNIKEEYGQEVIDKINENVDFNDVWRVVMVDCEQEVTDAGRMEDTIKQMYDTFPNLKSKKRHELALCKSPLLTGATVDGIMGIKGCLPASEVRELQIYKSEDVEIPLVTEGHQDVGSLCGCTKAVFVDKDIVALSKEKSKTEKTEKTESRVKKAVKKSGPPAIF